LSKVVLLATQKLAGFFMKWTTLNFGKYAGLSLPQIILADADWFFLAFNKGVFWGKPGEEAKFWQPKPGRSKSPSRIQKTGK
jgi:hypothetical protein